MMCMMCGAFDLTEANELLANGCLNGTYYLPVCVLFCVCVCVCLCLCVCVCVCVWVCVCVAVGLSISQRRMSC
jgi:hypothetical protein